MNFSSIDPGDLAVLEVEVGVSQLGKVVGLFEVLEREIGPEALREVELDIAEGTVKIHLAALFTHFGARNRTELATKS